ncbi:uncharacterized protein LOC142225923 [Haematobia irritans]|uniref:uncharacterized protein LOC142225923 n=1 Tax=Haematobia irritans TaxID=7368 RepID=UPI003F4FB317
MMSQSSQIVDSFDEIEMNKLNQNITILHMNIRSLRKNFLTFLTHIKNILNNIQIIVLSETNIQDDEKNMYNIAGFNSTFINRDGRGGGIAVFIREHHMHEIIPIHTISFEALKIVIMPPNESCLTLLPVYRPPKQSITSFISELEQCILDVNKKHDMIIVGDTNINIKINNRTTTKYLGMLSTYGLQCMVMATTRENMKKDCSTCIDHLFVRTKKTTHAVVVATSISDHHTIFGCIGSDNNARNFQKSANNKENVTAKINNNKVNQMLRNTEIQK